MQYLELQHTLQGDVHGRREKFRKSGRSRYCAARAPNSTHREVRQVRPGDARPRSHSLEGPDRPADLRQRLERSLEALGGTFQDVNERVSLESAGPEIATGDGRADGDLLLRRRRKTAGQLRPPQALARIAPGSCPQQGLNTCAHCRGPERNSRQNLGGSALKWLVPMRGELIPA